MKAVHQNKQSFRIQGFPSHRAHSLSHMGAAIRCRGSVYVWVRESGDLRPQSVPVMKEAVSRTVKSMPDACSSGCPKRSLLKTGVSPLQTGNT